MKRLVKKYKVIVEAHVNMSRRSHIMVFGRKPTEEDIFHVYEKSLDLIEEVKPKIWVEEYYVVENN